MNTTFLTKPRTVSGAPLQASSMMLILVMTLSCQGIEGAFNNPASQSQPLQWREFAPTLNTILLDMTEGAKQSPRELQSITSAYTDFLHIDELGNFAYPEMFPCVITQIISYYHLWLQCLCCNAEAMKKWRVFLFNKDFKAVLDRKEKQAKNASEENRTDVLFFWRLIAEWETNGNKHTAVTKKMKKQLVKHIETNDIAGHSKQQLKQWMEEGIRRERKRISDCLKSTEKTESDCEKSILEEKCFEPNDKNWSHSGSFNGGTGSGSSNNAGTSEMSPRSDTGSMSRTIEIIDPTTKRNFSNTEIEDKCHETDTDTESIKSQSRYSDDDLAIELLKIKKNPYCFASDESDYASIHTGTCTPESMKSFRFMDETALNILKDEKLGKVLYPSFMGDADADSSTDGKREEILARVRDIITTANKELKKSDEESLLRSLNSTPEFTSSSESSSSSS